MYNDGDFPAETLAQFGALKKRSEFFLTAQNGNMLRGIKTGDNTAVMESEILCFRSELKALTTVFAKEWDIDLR